MLVGVSPRKSQEVGMRSSTAFVCAFAVSASACTGTEGDLLRTPPGTKPPADAATERPKPSPLSSWQIQLTGTLDTTYDVQIYVSDLGTPVSTLQTLHNAGRIAICYFSAGTREPFRSDAALFPASSLGAPLPDYPDERWVDVRDATVRSIMQARVAKAAAAGCDGIHPSGLGAFLANTELDFERTDELAYGRWLSAVAHDAGLSIGLVEGDARLSQDLAADFDWNVVWSCIDSGCSAAAPFTALAKPVLVIEYGDETRAAEVCPKAKAAGLSAIIKRDSDLDAYRAGCP
jgi:hypothetical protein